MIGLKAISSLEERFHDTEEAEGSIPSSPTNSSEMGELAEFKLISRFMHLGLNVCLSLRKTKYDLLIEKNNRFLTVQVKTARLVRDVLTFHAHGTTYDGSLFDYKDLDYFGVYSPNLDTCYLIPTSEVGTTLATLRLGPTKNNQLKGIRLASDFQI